MYKQHGYFLICILSVTMIYIVIVLGLALSFRPGLPSISRMLVDQPDVLPLLYILFVLVAYELRTVAIMEADIKNPFNYVKFVLGFLQSLGLVLIPVAHLDYQLPWHLAAAILVIVSTVLRELAFEDYRMIRLLSPCRGRVAWTLVDVLHLLTLLAISILSLVYIIITMTVPNSEHVTQVSFVEYALFLLVAGVNVFNVRKL